LICTVEESMNQPPQALRDRAEKCRRLARTILDDGDWLERHAINLEAEADALEREQRRPHPTVLIAPAAQHKPKKRKAKKP
jgi:hypothetical protein